jgi:TonB family protein
MLIALAWFNPDWFKIEPRRVIRIAGEDYDLDRFQLSELVLTPPPATAAPLPAPPPVPAPAEPLVELPPEAAPPPPPPPPPPVQPPPPPPPPDRAIAPDDVLEEGARPDGQPRPSRGETREPARTAGAETEQTPQQVQEERRGQAAQNSRPATRGSGDADDEIAMNTNPNALAPPRNLRSDAERILESQFEAARRSQAGRTGTQRGQTLGNFATDEPQILSPTKGFDFGPYINGVLSRLRQSWYSVMPESAILGQKGRVVTVFTITKSGTIVDARIVANSGTAALDRGAMSAINLSNPFQRLPSDFDGDVLTLQITFLYNLR